MYVLRNKCIDLIRGFGVSSGLSSDDMQISGFGRKILETLECSPGYLKKYGFEKWNEYREWAKPFYQSALYQFVCYILPTKEEMESQS